MTDEKYNGYTNYETWLWSLWLDNTEGLSDYWITRANEIKKDSDNPLHDVAEALLFDADEMAEQWMPEQSGVFADLINGAMSKIDWRDIAENLLDN